MNMKSLLPSKNEMILIGFVVVCTVIVSFIIVRNHSPHPCRAGCGVKVNNPDDHTVPCPNCGVGIYNCIETFTAVATVSDDSAVPPPTYPEHRAKCDACGHIYYTCDKTSVIEEEKQSRYHHRIIGKREDGTPIYACKPEDSLSVPIPDK